MTYAFAAAGTGGHVFPALAVADELVRRGVDSADIVFFGGDRIEADAVPAAGYELVELDIRGLRRSLSPANLALPGVVRRAGRRIADELARRARGVMVAFGGYVTVPAVLAAGRSGYPVVIHEQNAVPGLANRLASRRAARTLVAFPLTLERLRGSSLSGNPLVPAIASFDRSRVRKGALASYGLDPERRVLGVFGGSQGAAALNAALGDGIHEVLVAGHSVLHLTGPDHYEEVTARSAGMERWITLPYEGNMDRFYAASDLVVSRAGAMTISELTATGTPALVVPLPAGKGYQAQNAAEMEAAGGCSVIDQSDIDSVVPRAVGLLDDDGERASMAAAAASVGRPHATEDVAGAVLEVAGG